MEVLEEFEWECRRSPSTCSLEYAAAPLAPSPCQCVTDMHRHCHHDSISREHSFAPISDSNATYSSSCSSMLSLACTPSHEPIRLGSLSFLYAEKETLIGSAADRFRGMPADQEKKWDAGISFAGGWHRRQKWKNMEKMRWWN